MESYGNKWGRQIGLINNNGQLELKWMSITMQSMLRLRAFELPQKLQKDYDQIQEFVDQFNGQGPQGVNRAYQYADNKWTHMHKQNLFLELAMMGMIVGPLMAFVVIFIATTNIILAGSALATIAMILLTVLALMTANGWEIGEIEATCLIILAGFAIDYVVHLAHAYNSSTLPTRAERTTNAIADMGISVFSGMFTSMLASLPLFLCTVRFFAVFGAFLCWTMTMSWAWANLFFMSLMATFGPQPMENGIMMGSFQACIPAKLRVKLESSRTEKIEKTTSTGV